MAAFLMAVDEINANNYLPNVRINIAAAFHHEAYGGILGSQELLKANFSTDRNGLHVPTSTFVGNNPIGVDFVIGTGDDDETEHAGLVFQNSKIVQLHSVAMDTRFAMGRSYPANTYKVQDVPVVSYQGMVWQELFCNYFGWKKFAVFVASETNSIKSSIEVADFTYCDDLYKMTVQSFDLGETDFSTQIHGAKVLGATVFFIASPPTEAGRLLEQMYDSGLLTEGTQVVGNHYLMDPEVIAAFKDQSPSRVKAIMRGVMACKFAPKYALKATPGGRRFVKSFAALPTTVTVSAKAVTCNSGDALRKDDTGQYLYKKTVLGKQLCGGLDFSQFSPDDNGLSMYDLTPYAYDAVYSFANAVKLILNATDNDKEALRGDNFFNFLVNNVTLEEGATGYVKYFAGMPLYQFMASGDREEGFYYSIHNFQEAAYDKTAVTGSGGFVQVGLWNLEEGGLTRCTATNQNDLSVDSTGAGTVACATSIQYRTKDNTAPKDAPPPILVVMDEATRTFLLFFGALTMLIVLVALGVTALRRRTKLMRSSHVHMVWATLAGCACAAGRTIVSGVLSSDDVCRARFVLGHLSFFATLLPLVWRMWRLTYLSNYKGLTRSKVTPRFVLQVHCAVMALVALYIGIAAGVGQPHQSWTRSEVANQYTHISVCTLTRSEFETTLFAVEAAVVIFANKVAQGVKSVPDLAQEKAYYSLAMTVIFAVCILLWPIVALINLPISIQELIAGIGFFIAPLAVVFLILGPKFYAVFTDDEAAKFIVSVRVKPTDTRLAQLGKVFTLAGGVPSAQNSPREAGEAGRMSKAARAQKRALVRLEDAGYRKHTYGEKMQLYRAQIEKWQALRMCLDGTADDGVSGVSLKSRVSSSEEGGGDDRMTVDQLIAAAQKAATRESEIEGGLPSAGDRRASNSNLDSVSEDMLEIKPFHTFS